ncbi:hypothetical protein KEM54_006502 [Ascosphaera aggregata]|nr:hypothetical protein KEM54_006502 [Ascosphaera aggregata]
MSHESSEEEPTKKADSPARDGWASVRKNFLLALTAAFLSLQLLFFGNMLYMHASQFKSTQRYHNLKMLFVDYDGSVIGQAVLDAYREHEASDFPTMHREPADMYPTPRDARQAVCNGGYWAAIYAHKDASSDLVSSITQGDEQKVGVSYVWNSVLWPPFTESGIHAKIVVLLESARQAYYAMNASTMIEHIDLSSQDALDSFLNPLRVEEINILPTPQGARILYNTVSMVMPIIQQFFFMVAMNGIAEQVQIFTLLGWKANFGLRMLISYAFTLFTALCMAGYFWAYKEDWDVNFGQYVLSVLVLWLYAHIHILMVDIGTAFLPLALMPFCVLTWIIMNVTSTVAPLEISPGVFKWGYVLPGRVTYEILLQIWSRGCNNNLHRTLPVLLGWEIVGSLIAPWGILNRCKAAIMAKQMRGEEDRSSVSVSRQISSEETEPGKSIAMVPEVQRTQSLRESQRLDRLAYGPSFPSYHINDTASQHQSIFNGRTGVVALQDDSEYTNTVDPYKLLAPRTRLSRDSAPGIRVLSTNGLERNVRDELGLVLIYAAGVQFYRRYQIKRCRDDGSWNKPKTSDSTDMTEEIPFGSRALEQGVVVEGVWTSQPSTPVRTDCETDDNSRPGTIGAAKSVSENSLLQPGTSASNAGHATSGDSSPRKPALQSSSPRTPVPLRWRSEGSPSRIIRSNEIPEKSRVISERTASRLTSSSSELLMSKRKPDPDQTERSLSSTGLSQKTIHSSISDAASSREPLLSPTSRLPTVTETSNLLNQRALHDDTPSISTSELTAVDSLAKPNQTNTDDQNLTSKAQ